MDEPWVASLAAWFVVMAMLLVVVLRARRHSS
jgi:hypothetical protein